MQAVLKAVGCVKHVVYGLMHMQKAEDYTFNCPSGQLYGRAGRRCTLEDAERMLEIYIQASTLITVGMLVPGCGPFASTDVS